MNYKIIKVGRAKDNDIILSDKSVSRYHCEFFFDQDGNIFLTDKNSSNGTFVNGKKIIGSVQLNQNDIVKPGLDNPIRWKDFSSNSQQQNHSSIGPIDNQEISEPLNVLKIEEKGSLKSIIKTISITLLVIAALIGIIFFINESDDGRKNSNANQTSKIDQSDNHSNSVDPENPNGSTNSKDSPTQNDQEPIVDPNTSGETQNKPKFPEANQEIRYDFSCLNDKNDYGTTAVLGELEKLGSEITNEIGPKVTVKDEEMVGNNLLRDCKRKFTFINKGKEIENLRILLNQLTNQIKNPKGFAYEIYLISSKDLNAFTAGGKIFVTTQMYQFCNSNDELACIIGHEIYHNELGHIKEQIKKEKIFTEEVAVLAQIASIPFGQKKETHCDLTGIDLAIAAGYNGCVNINLWNRMQKESKEGEYNVFENLLRSHPYSTKRAQCSSNHLYNNYGINCHSNKTN